MYLFAFIGFILFWFLLHWTKKFGWIEYWKCRNILYLNVYVFIQNKHFHRILNKWSSCFLHWYIISIKCIFSILLKEDKKNRRTIGCKLKYSTFPRGINENNLKKFFFVPENNENILHENIYIFIHIWSYIGNDQFLIDSEIIFEKSVRKKIVFFLVVISILYIHRCVRKMNRSNHTFCGISSFFPHNLFSIANKNLQQCQASRHRILTAYFKW